MKSISVVNSNFLEDHKKLWKRDLHPKTTAVFSYFRIAAKVDNLLGTYVVNYFAGVYVKPGHLANIKYLDLDRLYFRDIVSRLNEGNRKAFED
jgi:hypothetical protein